jgi:aryl sulfotransferase
MLPASRRNAVPVHYESPDEDSARWDGFEFRSGDVVVSTRSKHGTTWVQAIILHLVHGGALPAPLATLSPWLDARFEPIADVRARLAAQDHRRVVKTHTPLDGLPLDPRARFVVVARHPLDAAVSLWHQGANLDRVRMARLTGTHPPEDRPPRTPLPTWLRRWTAIDADPIASLDSLDGVLHHYADAWARRTADEVVLVHFDDLKADLSSEVRRIATAIGIDPDPADVREVVAATTFEAMRARADELAPDATGVLVDRAAFFRRGTSGAGREVLTEAESAAFERRVRDRLPADLADWLLRP